MIPMSFIKQLSFLDLTEESDGNDAGYGLADLSGEGLQQNEMGKDLPGCGLLQTEYQNQIWYLRLNEGM